MCSSFLVLYLLVAAAYAAPRPNLTPTVTLDNGTFTGTTDGVSDIFRGIKFADAPRFALPIAVGPYNGDVDATAFGPPCPQQGSQTVDGLEASIYPSEDCLNLNVWVPSGTVPGAKLPVAVWIFGGGFQAGSTASNDGGVIVGRSIELGEPVLYVSMNYRLSAFGFIAGEEIKQAGVGNIGLDDQRVALRWIQKYIDAFGGDPDRVTIWGESAGAISVSLQMLTNGGNTEGLFHGAFMQSGAPIPAGDISNGQAEYDALVQETSCEDAEDTLACLRNVEYEVLKAAVDKSPSIMGYQSLRLAWLPRADGRFLPDHPQNLVLEGAVANIPFVTGNCDDEGTLFSISNLNISNDAQFRQYMLTNYIQNATEEDVGDLFDTLYPDDPAQGSPFGTGSSFSYHQYKRLAAIQGDLVFQAPRRFFVNHTADVQPTWSFLSKRQKDQKILGILPIGSAHASDLSNIYGPGDMTDYLVYFVNTGNPNGQDSGLIEWPPYNLQDRNQLVFLDGDVPLAIEPDNYRVGGFDKLTELSLEFPL